MSTFGLGIVHLQNHCGLVREITKVNLHFWMLKRDAENTSCHGRDSFGNEVRGEWRGQLLVVDQKRRLKGRGSDSERQGKGVSGIYSV